LSALLTQGIQVSRLARQTLRAAWNKPLIDIDTCSKTLADHVDEYARMRRVREKLQMCMQFIKGCSSAAQNLTVPAEIKKRAYLQESVALYSLQDLMEVSEGSLHTVLETQLKQMVAHIKRQCARCRQMGSVCGICDEQSQLIFPFDEDVVKCPDCSALLHVECRATGSKCRFCLRRKK
jgi:1,2-phenylacetyl-CoA epoxidase catalytic subunit